MNNLKARVPYEAPECEIIQLASEDILEDSLNHGLGGANIGGENID